LAFRTETLIGNVGLVSGAQLGQMVVCNLVNNLAVTGALPLAMSMSLIMDKELPERYLQEMVQALTVTAKKAGMDIVSASTKIDGTGGIYITVSGVGFLPPGINLGIENICTGDVLILTGSVGEYGLALLGVEGTTLRNIRGIFPIFSELVQELVGLGGLHLVCLPGELGLAGAIEDIAVQSLTNITIFEQRIPVSSKVSSRCKRLKMDPLYLACDNRLLLVVAREYEDLILEALSEHPLGEEAEVIGLVGEHTATGQVWISNDNGDCISLQSKVGKRK